MPPVSLRTPVVLVTNTTKRGLTTSKFPHSNVSKINTTSSACWAINLNSISLCLQLFWFQLVVLILPQIPFSLLICLMIAFCLSDTLSRHWISFPAVSQLASKFDTKRKPNLTCCPTYSGRLISAILLGWQPVRLLPCWSFANFR